MEKVIACKVCEEICIGSDHRAVRLELSVGNWACRRRRGKKQMTKWTVEKAIYKCQLDAALVGKRLFETGTDSRVEGMEQAMLEAASQAKADQTQKEAAGNNPDRKLLQDLIQDRRRLQACSDLEVPGRLA